MANEYVRFQRGSQAAYDALKAAGQLDSNTLYFIYDGNNGGVGALYMGSRIISGGDITIASASLDDLADVILTDTGANSFLVKDGETGNWVSKSLEDIITLIQSELDIPEAPVAQVFQATMAADDANELAAIARVVGDKAIVSGDIAIVKTLIAEGKYQHTAFVYDGDAWAAMDGNYNADNVYFDNDLVFTYAFGRYAPDTSGRVKVPAKGINLQSLLEDAYALETKTGLKTANPTASITSTTKYYEVGSTGTVDVTVSLSGDGEYKYGYSTDPADGVEGDTATTVKNDTTTGVAVDTSKDAPYEVTFNGAAVSPKAAKGATFTLSPAVQTEKKEMKAYGTVHYTKGGIPVSNLGKMYPDQAIPAGSVNSGENAKIRWYIPMYHGFTYSDNVIADPSVITADQVKALPTKITGESAYNATKTTSATASKAWRQYFLAVPSSYGWTMSNAKDGNNIDCTVRQAADVTITYGSGDTAVDVVYNVFYINNAADYGTLKITWTLA